MKLKKAATPSRRGFLARLAAVGTMLGGALPELRAGTLMETPIAPPPATPLSPAASALLHSSALADAEVKMLLASAGPGVSIMPPEHTYDMGAQGQGIALPVKNSSGIVTAYVIYGSSGVPGASSQAGSHAIKILLKDNGTAAVAHNGKTYVTPTEAADQVEILYATFFTDKFIETQVSAQVNRYATPHKRIGLPATAMPPAALSICIAKYELCMSMLAAKVGIKKGSLADLALAGCIACHVASFATSGSINSVLCLVPCALAAHYVPDWQLGRARCLAGFKTCMGGAALL
jgi:hypothetical protein